MENLAAIFTAIPVCCVDTEFASLTHAQLMEKVRALQNLAYRLGVEEGMIDLCSCVIELCTSVITPLT